MSEHDDKMIVKVIVPPSLLLFFKQAAKDLSEGGKLEEMKVEVDKSLHDDSVIMITEDGERLPMDVKMLS